MRIEKCRICSNKKLVQIGSLGNIALSNFTNTPKNGRKYPLELIHCNDCNLLQLAHNTPRRLLYRNYWYQSHINPVIVQNLKEIAKQCRGVHIDIGANDGTLLKYSKAKKKIAVDPSGIKPDGFKWIKDYWENVHISPADTITAIACLYDLPNPNKFMQNIKAHLKPNGVFIAQLMTLHPFIENNDIGNICHEHLLYFSFNSLVRLYEQNGLEIYRVEENNMNGGSYRIFARHYQKGSIKFREKIYTVKELKNFFKKVEKNKKKMIQFMKNHPLVGFGASTKMGTIVQYYGITPKVIVDANPDKIGKFTVSKAQVIDKIPEGTEYLWVFPYGFIDYFKKKEKNYKGKWVVTIPEFKII
jgi:hypothetical protein